MIKKDKWLFIVNPISGNGVSLKRIPYIEKYIKKYNLDAKITETKYKGHAIEISKEGVEKYSVIVSVGGDGTHNEVLQPLIGKDTVFGAISAGSGNDFIHALGFSENFEENEYRTLFEKKTIQLDIGKCNDRYFINAFGVGYDATVAYEMDKLSSKGRRSKMHYLTSVLKNIFFYKSSGMEIKINGQTKKIDALIATVGNGKRVGGGFYLTPHALVNDNLFDICIISERPFVSRINILGKVMKKKHAKTANVWYSNSEHVILEYKKDIPYHVDGEVELGRYFDISLIPYKLKVIYNHYQKNNDYLK